MNDEEKKKKIEEVRKICHAAGGPGTKDGWTTLWKQGLTLWDLNGPTPVLVDEVKKAIERQHLSLNETVLVPGCGAAYDVKSLSDIGMKHVVGIDLAEEAIERAIIINENVPNIDLFCGDFFLDKRLMNESFSFVFDYTFFCAIPPSLRSKWGARVASLLKPGGRLLTLAFPIADDVIANDPDVAGPPQYVILLKT